MKIGRWNCYYSWLPLAQAKWAWLPFTEKYISRDTVVAFDPGSKKETTAVLQFDHSDVYWLWFVIIRISEPETTRMTWRHL